MPRRISDISVNLLGRVQSTAEAVVSACDRISAETAADCAGLLSATDRFLEWVTDYAAQKVAEGGGSKDGSRGSN